MWYLFCHYLSHCFLKLLSNGCAKRRAASFQRREGGFVSLDRLQKTLKDTSEVNTIFAHPVSSFRSLVHVMANVRPPTKRSVCKIYYVTGHVTDLTSACCEERATAALNTCVCDAQPREALYWRSTSLAKYFSSEASSPTQTQFPSNVS